MISNFSDFSKADLSLIIFVHFVCMCVCSLIVLYIKILICFKTIQDTVITHSHKALYYQVIHPSACLHYRSIGRFPPLALFS